MKWGEFLKLMNDAGVRMDDEIDYIEIEGDGALFINRRRTSENPESYTVNVVDVFDG